MARKDKAVKFCLALLKQPFHRRGNYPVAGEDREVPRGPAKNGGGGGRGGGLETDRDKDNLLIGLCGDLDGLVDPLHDPHVTAAGL